MGYENFSRCRWDSHFQIITKLEKKKNTDTKYNLQQSEFWTYLIIDENITDRPKTFFMVLIF